MSDIDAVREMSWQDRVQMIVEDPSVIDALLAEHDALVARAKQTEADNERLRAMLEIIEEYDPVQEWPFSLRLATVRNARAALAAPQEPPGYRCPEMHPHSSRPSRCDSPFDRAECEADARLIAALGPDAARLLADLRDFAGGVELFDARAEKWRDGLLARFERLGEQA